MKPADFYGLAVSPGIADKKRKALGIDKARERTLVDMADRRQLEL